MQYGPGPASIALAAESQGELDSTFIQLLVLFVTKRTSIPGTEVLYGGYDSLDVAEKALLSALKVDQGMFDSSLSCADFEQTNDILFHLNLIDNQQAKRLNFFNII
jgi:hypothetical protein